MPANGKQKLGDLFRNRREQGLPGLPVMSVTLNEGLVGRDTLDRKTDTNLDMDEHLLIKAGDIAYNMMRMWQGASGLAKHDGVVSPAYVVLAPKNGIDPVFASYWFKSSRMVYLFWAYSYGLTNDRLRLYFKDFAEISVSLPPQDEQVRIGDILSLWDKAIAQTEKLIEVKWKLKKGLMQQLLTGKRRFPGFTKPWKTVTIQDVCDVQIGGTPARNNATYWAEPGTGNPWASISDLNGKWITSTKEQITDLATKNSNTKLVTKGTTLMSFKLTVGKTARAGIDLYTNEAIAAFYPKQKLVESDYLYLTLPIAASRTLTDQAVKGKTLNKKKINSMLLELPPIEEQREISKFVSVADSEIGTLCSLSDQLKKQKRGLMQKLLTGQIWGKAIKEITA